MSAGDQSATLTAGPLPTGATFDGSTGVFDWTPIAAQQGTYRLAFSAINSAGESGTAYSAVQVDAGEPVVDRIANAASGSVQGACSPGAIARIEGRWLTQGDEASDPSGGSLELAGTSVVVEGKSVPILQASPTRIDILCPDAGPASSFEIAVRTPGSVSQPASRPCRMQRRSGDLHGGRRRIGTGLGFTRRRLETGDGSQLPVRG